MPSRFRRTLAFLGLGLVLLLPAAARADEPFYKVIPYVRLLDKYGAYEPLIDLVLEQVLAAQKTEAVVRVALGSPQLSARLEVFKFTGTIEAEGGDSCWLGDNRIKVRVPVEIRYEIDLGRLRAKDLRYDPNRNVLELTMPRVTLAKVVPDYDAMEVLEKANPTFRSRASWYELKESVLAQQVRPSAEKLGQEHIAEAQLVGRGVLSELFGKLYAPAQQFKGIAIVVK